MLYYLAICVGVVIGQLTTLTLYKTISCICFAISLFAFNQFSKTVVKFNKIQTTLTLFSLVIICFGYSSLRTNIRTSTQITQPISKINTAGYLISPIKQFESSNQVTIKITQGSLEGKNISLSFAKNITLHPATNYQFKLNVYPNSKVNNIDNFDMNTYNLANNISGTAKLIDYHYFSSNNAVLAIINKYRSQLIAYLANTTSGYKYSGFFIALATGYQGYIPKEQWSTFQQTGINHIVSISGLHLTLVTGFFAVLLVQLLKRTKPTQTPRQIIIALLSIIFATLYAALSGFGIPIQRALYMLIISSYLLTSRKYLPIIYQLLICLAISLIIDPFAVFSIGFWFSYTLIAGLLLIITQKPYENKYHQAIHTQMVILLLGIPLSLYYFSKVSLISTITNLWAVPVLGTIFTPLVLVSALLHIGFIIKLVTTLLNYAMLPIEMLANIAMFSQAKPNLATVILAYIGIVLFILKIPFKHKNKLALLLFSSIFFVSSKGIANSSAKLTIFSAHSGGVVLIQTKQTNSLYIHSESHSIIQTLNTVLPNLHAQNITYLDYLFTNNYESALQYLSENKIHINRDLTTTTYHDGIYFTQLENNSILLQGRKQNVYIGICDKENLNSRIFDNIILPDMSSKCNWLYKQQPQNLIINGNNKSQSKIDNLINNLHFNTENIQNISNNNSIELLIK